MAYRIPFNKPFLVGKELQYIARAVELGNLAGDGEFSRRCAALLEQRLGVPHVILTASATAALEMAALLCPLQGHDAVVPSFTFVSTANAVLRAGGRVILADVDPVTLNLTAEQAQRHATPRTKAVFPVHYAGIPCDMEAIVSLAAERGWMVVEDAAQAVHSWAGERALGTLGDLGVYSFHETKNYISGQGGALCVNRPELYERAVVLKDKGTNRQAFFRGEVDRYTWVDIGGPFIMSELTAAFLLAQLEALDQITARRKEIFNRYLEGLKPLEQAGYVQLPHIPHDARINYHMMYLLLPDQARRDRLIAQLRQRGINAVFHYVPLHASPMGQKLGYRPEDLPVSLSVSSRLVRLPFYYDLSPQDQAMVIEAVTEIVRKL